VVWVIGEEFTKGLEVCGAVRGECLFLIFEEGEASGLEEV
jgi:hypothetical protein